MKFQNLNSSIEETYKSLLNDKGEVVIPESWYRIVALLIFALQTAKLFTSDLVDKYIDCIIDALKKLLDPSVPAKK